MPQRLSFLYMNLYQEDNQQIDTRINVTQPTAFTRMTQKGNILEHVHSD